MSRRMWGCALACIVGVIPAATGQNAIMDFEGLPAGTVVDELSVGQGVSGPLTGVIKVVGESFLGSNSAVIFDSSNPTGEDEDLGTPNEAFGGPGISTDGTLTNDTPFDNILILAEDLVDNNNDGLVDDPDDTFAPGSFVSFDFSMTGPPGLIGTATVYELTFIDIGDAEAPPFIEVSGPDLPLVTIPIPIAGDNGAVTVDVNEMGVSLLTVVFNGSGAVGEAVFRQDEAPCTFRTETQCEWGKKCETYKKKCYEYKFSKYGCYSKYSYSYYKCYKDWEQPEEDPNKAACILRDNFDDCFPDGLVVGCEEGKTLKLTSARAVRNFLPQTGRPRVLCKDYVDPGSSYSKYKKYKYGKKYGRECIDYTKEDWDDRDYSQKRENRNRNKCYKKKRGYDSYCPDPGHFAGAVVALTLNVTFDLCIEDFSECPTNLIDLVVVDPDSACFGMTVGEVLEEANKALGGCETEIDAKELYCCVKKINENFEGGDIDMGFLGRDTVPMVDLPILVNAGDDGFVDFMGRTWLSDTNFNTGETFTTDNPIAGSPDGEPYHSERWDRETGPELMYSFPIPNGTYIVKLHFAEFYSEITGPGQRVFDVLIENVLALENYDIFAVGGFETAVIEEFEVVVSDGELNIEFIHGIENPKISGIEIHEAP